VKYDVLRRMTDQNDDIRSLQLRRARTRNATSDSAPSAQSLLKYGQRIELSADKHAYGVSSWFLCDW